MMKKIGLGIVVVLAVFLIYVSTKNGKFHYEKSGVINGTPEQIYTIVSDLNKGGLWNPYDQKDPAMKKTLTGPGNQVGSAMDFEGNSEAGSGKLTISKLVPNQLVEINLLMTKPFHAENLVRYTITPEGSGTRFTWAMEGDGGFLGKLVSTFIDCEKMVTKDFVVGIENLKRVVETQPAPVK